MKPAIIKASVFELPLGEIWFCLSIDLIKGYNLQKKVEMEIIRATTLNINVVSSPWKIMTINKATKISFEPAIQVIRYLIRLCISGCSLDFSKASNIPILFPLLEVGKKYKMKMFIPSRTMKRMIASDSTFISLSITNRADSRFTCN